MKRRAAVPLWLLAGMLLLLAASNLNVAAQERTLIFLNRAEATSIDPHTETFNPPLKVFQGVYEGLLRYNRDTLTVEPSLATSWTVSPDGRQFTFRLRRGVKFHDGTVMTAEAVKYSFDRMKALGLGFAFVLDSVASVEAPDAATIVIRLSKADPTFLGGIPLVYVVSPTAFKKNEKGNDWAREWATSNEAGTGPYQLTLWVKNQRLDLVRFPDYWRGWARPHVPKYIFSIVPESTTQRQLIERGAAQLADTIEFDDVDAMKSNPNVQILENESLRQFYLILNTTKGPLADVRVRRAIAAVVDQRSLAEKVLRGHATVPRSVLPVRMPMFDKTLPEPKPDLALARRLLAEAGVPSGGFTLTYLYFAPYEWQRINGELMQAALSPMGVNMRLEGLPFTTLSQRMINPDTRPDIAAVGSTIPTPDPDILLYPIFRSGSKYYANNGYRNEMVDRLLDEARTTLDQRARASLYSRIQRLLIEEVPVVPLTILNDIKAATRDVRGYKFDPMSPAAVNLYGLYFEGR